MQVLVKFKSRGRLEAFSLELKQVGTTLELSNLSCKLELFGEF